MVDYKVKYYKYKAKYLNLKQQQLQVQIGGKVFQKKQILYIVATISQRKLKKITKEITDTIIGKNIKPYRAPHITLFNLIINAENEDNMIFQDEKFYNQIKNIYDETMVDRNDPLILEAKPFPKDWTLPGYRPRYFLKNYKPLDRQKILDFRERIFDLIETFLGKPKINDYYDKWGSKYYIYSYHGKELFAESSYYDKWKQEFQMCKSTFESSVIQDKNRCAISSWKPHLNFLNDFDIQKHNPDLYEKLNQYYYRNDKVDMLVNKINHLPLEIYNEINMATQMRKITYAIDHILQKKFKQ